jgi:hypothetical protein
LFEIAEDKSSTLALTTGPRFTGADQLEYRWA